MARLPRDEYARRYGPTTGDHVRLADTGLEVRVEADDVGYGDEPLFGFGRNLRSRMLQADRATSESELDFVFLGVLLIDPLLGVRKTNVGVKDGRVAAVGRVGRGHGELHVGPATYPYPAHGLIATAAGVDSHVHLPTPRLVPAALSAGVTTLITAGFEEPPFGMTRMLAAMETAPVNVGLQACARTGDPATSTPLLAAGAVGLKVHEDYGAYPDVLDAALRSADAHDVAVCLHTDGLNESCEIDDTVAAVAGRTVHAYHVEGSAGGHAPDNLLLVAQPSVICSSTTSTLPFATGTAAEHRDMILAVHGGDPRAPEDVAAVDERIHPATMAAEGPLHELGAIAIINSDSQGVGRMGETIRRTWQLCDVMKRWRASDAGRGWPPGPAPDRPRDVPTVYGDPLGPDDNERVLRYLAKYTLEPAIVHGISHEVGSLAPGRLADVVLWRPSHFGAKPDMVYKCGFEAWGPLGEGNAAVERSEPTAYGPHWGATGGAGALLGTTFVSQLALDEGIAVRLGTRRRLVAVRGTRGLDRGAMHAHRTVAPIEIDPVDATVRLGGRVLAVDPVDELPLNRRYFLA